MESNETDLYASTLYRFSHFIAGLWVSMASGSTEELYMHEIHKQAIDNDAFEDPPAR